VGSVLSIFIGPISDGSRAVGAAGPSLKVADSFAA
jgi:hypothetical protein